MASKNYLSILIFSILSFLANSQQTTGIINFLNKTDIQPKLFSVKNARNGCLNASNIDQYHDLYSSVKLLLTREYYRYYNSNYKYILDNGKVQSQVNSDIPFPCSLNDTRSPEPPISVHRLRPGDIDIIGAMGDSITAGSTMMSKNFLQNLIEFRGQTALGGGLKDWRTFLTLPNILKVFNPHLYGFAVANTLARFRPARFNVAEPFAITQDMPYMAKVLIKRLKMDPKVDMKNHWKIISIFVGANDVCNEMCYYDNIEDFLANHRKYLYETLTILKGNIPRLLVNVISIPNIDTTIRIMKGIPLACKLIHKVSCHCIISDSFKGKKLKEISRILQHFQQIFVEVASLPEFQLEDFTAVPRTFDVNKTLRKLKNGNTDLRYFAIDCFHFSQYGNAVFSNMLWNEMLQVKTKNVSSLLRPFEIFSCPNRQLPYLSTLKNS